MTVKSACSSLLEKDLASLNCILDPDLCIPILLQQETVTTSLFRLGTWSMAQQTLQSALCYTRWPNGHNPCTDAADLH